MESTPKYTEEIHAERLLKILNRKNPCNMCPAAPRLSAGNDPNKAWKGYSPALWGAKRKAPACKVCVVFVGIWPGCSAKKSDKRCPCYLLGRFEAIKRTWLALEEKGYI